MKEVFDQCTVYSPGVENALAVEVSGTVRNGGELLGRRKARVGVDLVLEALSKVGGWGGKGRGVLGGEVDAVVVAVFRLVVITIASLSGMVN